MKMAKYVALLIAIFEMCPIYADNMAQKKGLAKAHVESAKIFVDQGKIIYSNSCMQSKLRIQYKLFDGFKLSKIELREFKTNEVFQNENNTAIIRRGIDGWFVSDIDSGYDHNISQGRREASVVVKEADSTSVYKYISSSNRESWINICFVLTTSDKKNGKNIATFSTCDDEGIIDGSVNIFSEAPKKLRGTDFILKKYASLDEERADLYVISPGSGISRGMRFKVLRPFREKCITPSYLGAIIYRSYKTMVDESSVTVDLIKTVFAIAHVLDTKSYDEFKYYSLDKNKNPRETELIIDTSSVESATAVILNYKHNYNRAVDNIWLCNLQKEAAKENMFVKCYFIDPTEEVKTIYISASTLTTDLDNLKKEAAVITIIDNYGTEHKVTLSYGVGDENYDLFIN